MNLNDRRAHCEAGFEARAAGRLNRRHASKRIVSRQARTHMAFEHLIREDKNIWSGLSGQNLPDWRHLLSAHTTACLEMF